MRHMQVACDISVDLVFKACIEVENLTVVKNERLRDNVLISVVCSHTFYQTTSFIVNESNLKTFWEACWYHGILHPPDDP